MSFFWKKAAAVICVAILSGSAILCWLHNDKAKATRIALRANELRSNAEKGSAGAQYSLGQMYFYGEGVPKNYAQAERWYYEAAEQGHAKAQYDVGYMYNLGLGVSQNYEEAARWYRKAADQGDARAQVNLALLYYYGRGVPKDYTEAVDWYRKAAGQGDAMGEDGLGLMYYQGRGVRQGYAEAARWYRKAADQGLAQGQYDLGYLFYRGQGVSQSLTEARHWFYKAADQGNEDAKHAIGTGFPMAVRLELSLQLFGGSFLLLGSFLTRKRWNPQMRIELVAGVLCIFVASLSWYGYTHYMIRCLLCGLNTFTVFKWLLDAVLVVLLVSIVRPKKRTIDQSNS